MKIYIIGTVGSGKTTIAKKLSEKYKIKYYELDKVVWDDLNCNIKRSDDDINKIFNKIIKQKNWIIEDVGRDIFRKGIKSADIVYYISLSKSYNYLRIISRWVKQKIGLESYNYKPTLRSLIEMFGWLRKDLKNKNNKVIYIKNNSKKYKIITLKDIRREFYLYD